MLKGIPHLLSPELLAALQAMGHGDRIAIVDGNYPGASAGPPLVRLDGHSATDVLAAVLTLMPLDAGIPKAACCPDARTPDDQLQPVLQEFARIVADHGDGVVLQPTAHVDFYALANSSHVMVQTGERRLYGNIVLRKGVIDPDGAAD